MVEAHAQSVDDYLIEGLSFKLGAGASYVTNRRSVSFFFSGSDTYSPASGVKVIIIKLNGSDWLDPKYCEAHVHSDEHGRYECHDDPLCTS